MKDDIVRSSRHKEKTMHEAIEAILDSVRPALAAEGGSLELVEVGDDTVQVRLKGVCRSCDGTLWTYRLRIERAMKEKLPQFRVLVLI
jgi:Fe-S cluster biogenesis protein NfuA